MKSNLKIVGLAVMLTMAATLFNGCKKSTPQNTDNTVTDAEAGSIVTSATSSSSGGMIYDITTAVSSTSQYGKKGVNRIQTATCNTPESNPINWSSSYGGYSFSYNGYSNYELLCSNGTTPSSFKVNDGYNGQFTYGTTFSGTATDTSNWTITGLDSSSAVYTFNGSFNPTGDYKETSGSKTFSYTYSINYVVTNVIFNKSLQQITGGTATITVAASLNGGNQYSGSGSVVFNSNGTATLTIGSYTTTITE